MVDGLSLLLPPAVSPCGRRAGPSPARGTLPPRGPYLIHIWGPQAYHVPHGRLCNSPPGHAWVSRGRVRGLRTLDDARGAWAVQRRYSGLSGELNNPPLVGCSFFVALTARVWKSRRSKRKWAEFCGVFTSSLVTHQPTSQLGPSLNEVAMGLESGATGEWKAGNSGLAARKREERKGDFWYHWLMILAIFTAACRSISP